MFWFPPPPYPNPSKDDASSVPLAVVLGGLLLTLAGLVIFG